MFQEEKTMFLSFPVPFYKVLRDQSILYYVALQLGALLHASYA